MRLVRPGPKEGRETWLPADQTDWLVVQCFRGEDWPRGGKGDGRPARRTAWDAGLVGTRMKRERRGPSRYTKMTPTKTGVGRGRAATERPPEDEAAEAVGESRGELRGAEEAEK
ncbi:hypothetical protein CDD83_10010 [Cordyceps sp. RAO-2017]|nr:hypothetical protein CDD83_10010 [Cordyceps sp. RAO-2017]